MVTQGRRGKRCQHVEKHNPQIQGKFCNATNDRGPQEPEEKKAQNCFNIKDSGVR